MGNNNLSNTKRPTNRLHGKKISSSVNSIIGNEKYRPLPKRLSIRFKVILVAIAISVIPSSLLSVTTYVITKRSGNKEIIQAQEQIAKVQLLRTQDLAAEFRQFLQVRFREVEVLTENTIFTNPNLWNGSTLEQKKAILTSFQTKTNLYEEIVFVDVKGSPLFQSQFSQNSDNDYSKLKYFQEAISSKKVIVATPDLNANKKKVGIEYIAPIVNAWTGKVNGVIYLFLPEKQVTKIFSDYTENGQQWYFIDSQGLFFAGSNREYINNKARIFFPNIDNLYRARKKSTGLYSNQVEKNQQLLSYFPVETQGLYPDKYLGALITTEIFPTFIELENSSWILLIVIIITTLIIGSIAVYIANSMTIPIINSIKAVELISQGKLDTRIPIRGKDELAMLGIKINQMAEKLMYLIERQTMLTKTSELMARIARARSMKQLQSPLNRFLAEVRFLIKSDRLIFYQFNQNWSGTVIAESVAQGFPKSLGSEINDPCFIENYIDKYKRGRIQATRNIYESGLTKCHIKQLEIFAVKSNLVIPVVIKTEIEPEKDELIGLLIAHQCSSTRIWNNFEIDYLKEVASQLGLALRGYGICQQVLEQQELLQQKIKYIIDKNQQLSCGDLTTYSSISCNELDDFNKFFESTIKGIVELIMHIKNKTQIVHTSLDRNKDIFNQLNQQILAQTSKIEQIIAAIEPITNHGQIISKNISETSKISHVAITQAGAEKTNFTYVIESITKLQKTVIESIKKIKSIEQSSVELIGTIPIFKKIILQTELLAKEIDKPNIEAKDSLSKKMRRLVIQLVEFMSEVEAIGENIQRQTSEVVRTMEIDSAQTLGLAPLAENANKNIAKVFKTSVEIDHLLQLTNSSTTSQMTALQKINTLTTKLTQLSERSSYQSQQAKNSLEITEVAIQRLQESVDIFKLEK